jgi:pyruvate/2-oxoglutarate dehydrogenase complex dihydrolipoamide acyltransferase (E2) component
MGTIGEKGEGAPKPLEPVSLKSASPSRIARDGARTPDSPRAILPEKRISPAAKALARTRGVDISRIAAGSGPHGRIVRRDVLDFIVSLGADRSEKAAAPEGTRSAPSGSAPERKVNRVEFKGWRKTIADRMEQSSREIPRYTMSVDADVTELSEKIKKLRGKEEDLHLTYLPFMMKAMVQGIREVPYVNSHCDKNGYTIFDEINIGIAVDLGEKLLVPVVKNVDGKSIMELAKELEGLVAKARADKLEPMDVEGGTITLTNVGMFHTVSATSIIMPPQVTILYMGFARDMPAVWEGKIEVRTIMSFGATYDHRVVNGAAGGRFLLKAKECMEDIGAFLLAIR